MSNADPPTYVDNILELVASGSIPMNGRSDPIMVATGEVQPVSLADLLAAMRAAERQEAAERQQAATGHVISSDAIRSQAITMLEDFVSTRIVEALAQLGVLPSTLRNQPSTLRNHPSMLIRVPVLPYMMPPDASVDARQSMLDSLCYLFATMDNRNGPAASPMEPAPVPPACEVL